MLQEYLRNIIVFTNMNNNYESTVCLALDRTSTVEALREEMRLMAFSDDMSVCAYATLIGAFVGRMTTHSILSAQ